MKNANALLKCVTNLIDLNNKGLGSGEIAKKANVIRKCVTNLIDLNDSYDTKMTLMTLEVT